MPASRLLLPAHLEQLVERACGLGGSSGFGGSRVVVGIAGEPGAGKTTLAEDLVVALGGRLGADAVAHLPMDGFHLADVQLRRLGLLDRKGAPETFDANGFLSVLQRLRSGHPATVFVPTFERVLEQPVAAAIAVPATVQVVVTEGNYFLVDVEPWPQVRELLDEVWFVELDPDERLRRLVARHAEFGKSEGAAREWALGPDEANARLVAATRDRADLVVRVPTPPA